MINTRKTRSKSLSALDAAKIVQENETRGRPPGAKNRTKFSGRGRKPKQPEPDGESWSSDDEEKSDSEKFRDLSKRQKMRNTKDLKKTMRKHNFWKIHSVFRIFLVFFSKFRISKLFF